VLVHCAVQVRDDVARHGDALPLRYGLTAVSPPPSVIGCSWHCTSIDSKTLVPIAALRITAARANVNVVRPIADDPGLR
jgi:hypothetical protein